MPKRIRYNQTDTLLFILLSIAVAALACFGTFSRRHAGLRPSAPDAAAFDARRLKTVSGE